MTPTVRLRVQLTVIAVVAVLSVGITGVYYARIPQELGLGRYSVTVELAGGAGLYTNANVTYRGSEIGKVSALRVTPTGASAVVSLSSDVSVPASTRAEVHSMSAIGEQFIDLLPDTDDGPFLGDGSVIPIDRTTIPTAVAPTIDRLDAAFRSVDPVTLGRVLDDSSLALGADGDTLGELLDSLGSVTTATRENIDPIAALVTDLDPVLGATAASSDAIRSWAASLATVTGQVSTRDGNLRSVIDGGEPLGAAVSGLFQDLRPTLPLLLSNLISVEQVAVTYNAALEQILVLYPPLIAATQGTGKANADAGDPGQNTYFAAQLNDPPPCTEGFLPADQRRSPAEVDTVPTPTDLYCKVAPDDPSAIRGARNLPCQEFPGRRAATVQLCRQGAYDPNNGSYITDDGSRWVESTLSDAPPATVEQMMLPDE
ncbi:MCE family protein [Rhodococcus sp. SORGH_AS_0303]|uniref:MCE family protein n=1 Tax=Rhodococcus sp. SORGH_AS_0303 TaxID=3041753 RepID=UPI00277EC9F1|nr:MlaD family protein [Rhodococcus sp. SORGH_AS_0303]MDQ1203110.1 phospholipid/cholesterol/gamma-HCH transport system substrate-binding protein [Rhodococcus sp. SORGH_AS_0303]